MLGVLLGWIPQGVAYAQDEGAKRIVVTMPRMPPTRTFCTFERDGESVTFEWDPLRPGSLKREAVFTTGNGGVTGSCYLEPARLGSKGETNYTWEYLGLGSIQDCTAGKPLAPDAAEAGLCFQDTATGTKDTLPHPFATVQWDALRALPLTVEVDDKGQTPQGPPTSEPRLTTEVLNQAPLGTPSRLFSASAESIAEDAAKAVTEVLVERARTKGLRLLTTQIQDLFCERLATKLPESVPIGETAPDSAAETPRLVFPRTCDLVTTARLEDLSGMGERLTQALQEDLAVAALDCVVGPCRFGQNIPGNWAALAPVLRQSTATAVAFARRDDARARAATRALIATLLETDWLMPTCDRSGTNGASCDQRANVLKALRYLSAASVSCFRSGRCDPARIEDMLKRPGRYFTIDAPSGKAIAETLGWWPGSASFVSTTVRVLEGKDFGSEADRVQSTLGLLFDAAALFIVATESGDKTNIPEMLAGLSVEYRRPPTSLSPAPDVYGRLATLSLLRRVLEGTVRRDLTEVAASATTLLAMLDKSSRCDGPELDDDDEEVDAPSGQAGSTSAKVKVKVVRCDDAWTSEHLRQAARIASALGAYLATYDGPKSLSDADRAARHEARKAALASLIDEATDRSRRKGDTIISVGSDLFASYVTSPFGGEFQPSLTLGVAVDHTFSCGAGLHAAVAPINLGAYAGTTIDPAEGRADGYREPEPTSALGFFSDLGITYLVESADVLVFVGGAVGHADVGSQPLSSPRADGSTEEDVGGFWYGGVALGLSMPLYDLN